MPSSSSVMCARLTLAEVAHDFDVSVESVRRWVRQADIDDGIKDGLTTAEQSELVQLRRDKRRLEQEVEILRRATPTDAAPMMFPWSLISPPKASLGDDLGCSVLPGVLRLVDAHGEDPEFGYRFLADELEIAGHRLGERRVAAVRSRLWSTTTKKGRRCGKGARPPFTTTSCSAADAPTGAHRHHRTPHRRGKAPAVRSRTVLDRIVGYSIDDRMTAQLAVSALPPPSLGANPTVVVHSVLHLPLVEWRAGSPRWAGSPPRV